MIRSLLLVALLVPAVQADDWTGKSVQVKEDGLKLGHKFETGLIRDGAALGKNKSYLVKADDGTRLELEGGFIFKSEATPAADAKPVPRRIDPKDPSIEKGEWFGLNVLPRRHPKNIRIGDWVDGKPEYWIPKNLSSAIVREDRDGFLRLFDNHREGWVDKNDMIKADDAPAYFDKAVKADPQNDYAWNMRGIAWEAKGEYDNAIKDYTEAIRVDPAESAYYNNRANSWDNKGEYEKAIKDYNEAIRLDPKDGLYYSNRGGSRVRLKQLDRAMEDFTQSIKIDNKYPKAYWNRGNLHHNNKNYDKAIDDFNEAISLDPKYDSAHNSRGRAWLAKEDYAQAEAEFGNAIRIMPNEEAYHNNRGVARMKLEQYPQALEDYSSALAMNPKYEMALSNRGECHFQAKMYAEAIADFNALSALNPKNAMAFKWKGYIHKVQKSYFLALAELNKATALDPDDAYPYTERGRIYYLQKKYSKAKHEHETAHERKPSPETNEMLALIYSTCPDAECRDGRKALEYAKAAMELAGKKEEGQYHQTLAAAYAETGDFELAVAEQRRGIEHLKAEKKPDAEDLKKAETRLDLYRARKPYRDED